MQRRVQLCRGRADEPHDALVSQHANGACCGCVRGRLCTECGDEAPEVLVERRCASQRTPLPARVRVRRVAQVSHDRLGACGVLDKPEDEVPGDEECTNGSSQERCRWWRVLLYRRQAREERVRRDGDKFDEVRRLEVIRDEPCDVRVHEYARLGARHRRRGISCVREQLRPVRGIRFPERDGVGAAESRHERVSRRIGS
mmetsp:Transcript_2082/g.5064  ORF Transcript_2082/g.5064 Transcript_2082/m.5064 type:complete len:200 (+) Transcript_2082:1828-2427(+)